MISFGQDSDPFPPSDLHVALLLIRNYMTCTFTTFSEGIFDWKIAYYETAGHICAVFTVSRVDSPLNGHNMPCFHILFIIYA